MISITIIIATKHLISLFHNTILSEISNTTWTPLWPLLQKGQRSTLRPDRLRLLSSVVHEVVPAGEDIREV